MSAESLIALHGESVQFQRVTVVKTPSGATARSWTNLGAAVGGWIQPMSSETILAYNARDINVSGSLYTTINPGVSIGDRVVVGVLKFGIIGIEDQAGLSRVFRFDLNESAGD